MGQRRNLFDNIPTVQKNANINSATPEGQNKLVISILFFKESYIFCALTFNEIMLIFRQWSDL